MQQMKKHKMKAQTNNFKTYIPVDKEILVSKPV